MKYGSIIYLITCTFRDRICITHSQYIFYGLFNSQFMIMFFLEHLRERRRNAIRSCCINSGFFVCQTVRNGNWNCTHAEATNRWLAHSWRDLTFRKISRLYNQFLGNILPRKSHQTRKIISCFLNTILSSYCRWHARPNGTPRTFLKFCVLFVEVQRNCVSKGGLFVDLSLWEWITVIFCFNFRVSCCQGRKNVKNSFTNHHNPMHWEGYKLSYMAIVSEETWGFGIALEEWL